MSTQLFAKIQFNPFQTLFKHLTTVRGKQGNLSSVTTTTVGGTEIQATLSAGGAVWEAVSAPVSAGVTISGTITYNVRAKESALTVNAGVRAKVYRLSGGVETLISTKDFGSELTTTDAAKNWTDAAPTSTALAIGDRLIYRLYAIPVGGTMAAGTITVTYGGASAGAAGDTYVTFTEAISFQAEPELVQSVPFVAASSITCDAALVSGNLVVVGIFWTDATVTVTGVSDGTNTYASMVPKNSVTGQATQRYYAKGVSAGTPTVTATLSDGGASMSGLTLHEFAGVDATNPIDSVHSASGSSTTPNSGNVATTATNVLLFGNLDVASASAVGTGFVAVFDDSVTTANKNQELLGKTATGSYAANWTAPSGTWLASVTAFKSAFQPGGVVATVGWPMLLGGAG